MCFTSIPILSEEVYQPPETLIQKLKGFEFSKDRITHYFCPTCGTHMVARVLPQKREEESTATWFIACGTLGDTKNIYRPRHEYLSDTLDGGIADFITVSNNKRVERWGRHPGDGEQLPSYWPSLLRRNLPIANTLKAYCKCRGIEFWITRLANGKMFEVRLCTCDSCRLANGMEWFSGASATIGPSYIFLDKDGQNQYQRGEKFGTLQIYPSSPGVERSFCGVCGATVFLDHTGAGEVRVAVGLLDADEGSRAETWLSWPLAEQEQVKH